MSKIGVEFPISYMHLHGKCTCSRCLMFVKYAATPKAPLGAMLRLRRSDEPGPPTAARFRLNVSHARFPRAALCAVTNLTWPKLVWTNTLLYRVCSTLMKLYVGHSSMICTNPVCRQKKCTLAVMASQSKWINQERTNFVLIFHFS